MQEPALSQALRDSHLTIGRVYLIETIHLSLFYGQVTGDPSFSLRLMALKIAGIRSRHPSIEGHLGMDRAGVASLL
jgi:hypothetical protein